jgi:uncharacterized protein YjbI with pentapeptide repeats
MLGENSADAVALKFSGSPNGAKWEALTADGWKRVFYTLDRVSPILSVNGGEGFADTFAPTIITRSLQEIRQSKNGRSADLRLVDLTGENLDDIDFTAADFSAGTLNRATFTKATLVDSKFIGSSLNRIRCDGATLDRADMTRAKLDGTSWGSPARAPGIILTSCSAQDAVLGGQSSPLDCEKANLASGDFRGAKLQGLNLKNAEASGAILAGAVLDRAVLDGATLARVVAVGTSFIGASLKGVNAQGALFIRADLTNADLTRAKMGAKAWLFAIAGTFSKDLDEKKFVQPPLIEAFRQQGVTLQPSDAVQVIEIGQRWTISNPAGPYVLVMNASSQIDVFSASPDLRPATLRDANCRGTRAPSASLAGADLRGVQWYSNPATLDHADLESAALNGSLLVQTDFTQAYLSGADLSNCVLVQAEFRGCLIGAGENRRAFSLEGSLLQQAKFDEATLVGSLLTDSAVAMARGVPLFRLNKSDEQYLDSGDLARLAPAFQKAGYPLGQNSKLTTSKTWVLDNRADPSSAPRLYRVRLISSILQVYDGDGKKLFRLDSVYEPFLSRPAASQELVAAFAQAGYSLVLGAPISIESYWQIDVGADVLKQKAVSYPVMRIYSESSYLPVYASVQLLLRDWPQYPSGIAFSATSALEKALNPASIGPSGYPRSWVDKLIDLETFMTIVST